MKGAERFLAAGRCKPVDRPPVWFMRQAGRSLPEYLALREKHTFLEMVRTPDLAVEVTLQPVRRYGVDAAVLFSDILVVAEAMGVEIAFEPGPVIQRPVLYETDVQALRVPDPVESLGYVMEALRLLRAELDGEAALLGFAGAPFTLASYLVEDRPGPAAARMRTLLKTDPRTATLLLEKVTRATALYLMAQVDAGAEAIQIFDTRAGCLAEREFREHALPWAQFLVRELAGSVPVIYFVLETPHLLPAAAESGADVLGVDWRVPLGEARRIVGEGRGVQGNLDPTVPFASSHVIAAETERVLREAGPEPGHIFNLGHGVLPQTPPEGLAQVVRTVREWKGT